MNNAAVSNLVYISNNQPMTDSKKLSEAVGIRHADVLRKIETILTNTSNDFKERNFVKLNIIEENAIGKKTSHSYFEMSRDGFLHIAMTFTGEKGTKLREQVITRFSEMECELKQQGGYSQIENH